MTKILEFEIASDIYSKITDGTHDSPKQQELGKPLITSKHIKGRNIDFDTAYLISEEDFNKINQRSQVEQWDVIVSMIGEYCGFCYVERNENIEYAVKNVGLYKTKSELEANWLYYYLTSSIGREYLNLVKSGSSQPYLSLGGLRSLPILKPRDNNQKKNIVKVLSDLDTKIEVNNKINAELEAMAKLIYDYWFVQFEFPISAELAASMGKPELEGKPYKASGGKMVFNKELKREIPAGWEDGTLNDIMTLYRGVTYNKNDISDQNAQNITPVLRATNISGNTIDLDSMVYVPSNLVNSNQKMKPGDILITMSSGSLNHIGKNGLYHFEKEVGFGAFCARLEAIDGHRAYLYCYTQSDFMSATIKNECLGTNINNLNASLVKGFKIVNPDKAVLKPFEQKMAAIFKKIGTNQKENQKLSELRDWLLPMLMNGQVKVGDVKEYEGDGEVGMAAEGGKHYN